MQWIGWTGLAVILSGTAAAAAEPEPGREAFRAIYKELVEINTTLSVGSCTEAAEAMAAHLREAGFPDSDLHMIVPPDRPKDGNLVAILPGSDPSAKALLLLAHIDVVEAKREDWARDPFALVEEDGYFYGRGTADDKAMAAVFVDSMMRYKKDGYRPKRTIKLALTCGEETPATFNGVEYLLKTNRDLIDAGMAINEGASGRLDEKGNYQFLGIQAGEKLYQDYTLEVTNKGGHSSRPVKDNAITHLAEGLARLGAYDFPVALNDAVRGHFERMAKIETGEAATAMAALVADPSDATAAALVAKDPSRNSMMRTTCVATMVNGGHAPNALPQRVTANVNCRILPGVTPEEIQAQLATILADDQIRISPVPEPGPKKGTLPPLTAEVMETVESVSSQIWPGVPLVPTMATGATDGRFLNDAGVPTYGLSGLFADPDGSGAHGLNERIRVQSLYEGRDFLYRVAKAFADRPSGGAGN
ncbi:MAG: M20/M25/M40 family metallo-hydrolase [Alphaproteobacteria bacterium]|nr:M20/M25/M40 family metallo-hydrolase [Alphaproteobacteria bacterium]